MSASHRETAAVRAHRIGAAINTLRPREKQVLLAMAEGQQNSEIATNMAISPLTVKVHARNGFKKLGVSNRTQLLRIIGVPAPPEGRETTVSKFDEAVLGMLCEGHGDGPIAAAQGVPVARVKSCIQRLLRTLKLANRTRLAGWYLTATKQAAPLHEGMK